MSQFKQMLNSYPHHMRTNKILAHVFFESLEYNVRVLLNSEAGGQNLSITSEEFFDLLINFMKGTKGMRGKCLEPQPKKLHRS